MKPILLIKSLVAGYTRKDGTVVAPYSNSRTKQAKPAPGQLPLFDDKKLPPNRFKGADPVSSTPDMFESESGDKTESPAFRKWFGDSKVVDDSGKPIVVYHGNADDFSEFKHVDWSKKDQGWLGRGFYFSTSPNTAGSYANMKPGNGSANVMPVYLSIKNPYKATIRDKESGMLADRRGDKDMPVKRRDELIAQGYDGVMLNYLNDDGEIKETEYVAFDPSQIKSATGNNGDYSSHPDITKAILFLKARP